MNSPEVKIADVLNGPLIRTAQGISCIIFSVLAVIMGGLSIILPPEHVTHPFFNFSWVLFVWPVLLFVLFLKHSASRDFNSSWSAAFFVSAYGAIPYFVPWAKHTGMVMPF